MNPGRSDCQVSHSVFVTFPFLTFPKKDENPEKHNKAQEPLQMTTATATAVQQQRQCAMGQEPRRRTRPGLETRTKLIFFFFNYYLPCMKSAQGRYGWTMQENLSKLVLQL